ncbi:hypothetical protein [Corynebacterium phoceense]|uniref:hypothetical protein n=1 Tax=Corynebacterium phoceense TaxID=1686286 RepID=UPI0011471D3A|nr:hypothetical protein [Corynebacterium phoceense]
MVALVGNAINELVARVVAEVAGVDGGPALSFGFIGGEGGAFLGGFTNGLARPAWRHLAIRESLVTVAAIAVGVSRRQFV